MGKKRKNYELSEDSEIRLVGIHHHRFARLLRFLKEHNAEITITNENSDGTEHSQTYYSKPKKNASKLNDLLIDALNISESSAREYSSRRLGLDDVQSNMDRVNGLGKVLFSVEYYFSFDNQIGEISLFSEDRDYFAPFDRKYWLRNLSNMFEQRKENDDLKSLNEIGPEKYIRSSPFLDMLKQNFQTELSNLILTMDLQILSHVVEEPKFRFTDLLSQLFSKSTESLDANSILSSEDFQEFMKSSDTFDQLFKTYENLQKENAYEIIPGYHHLRVLNGKERINKFDLSNLRSLDNKTDLMIKRYEILGALSKQKRPASEWSDEVKGILFITLLENLAFKSSVVKTARELIEDVRFIVFGSNNGVGLDTQFSNIALSELCETLVKYKSFHDLGNVFNVNKRNIITSRLYRFPEPDAAINNFRKEDLIEELTSKLFSYFKQKYENGLGVISH